MDVLKLEFGLIKGFLQAQDWFLDHFCHLSARKNQFIENESVINYF
jgi:hypothetical protein